MTTSATHRFIDIFGEARLQRGAWKTEQGRGTGRTYGAVLSGKEAVILSLLYPRQVHASPYLMNSTLHDAYVSGCAIERADLADVVERCRS